MVDATVSGPSRQVKCARQVAAVYAARAVAARPPVVVPPCPTPRRSTSNQTATPAHARQPSTQQYACAYARGANCETMVRAAYRE